MSIPVHQQSTSSLLQTLSLAMSFALGLPPRFLARSLPRLVSPARTFSTSSKSLVLSRIRPQQSFRVYGYTFGLGLSFLAFQSLTPARKIQCQTSSPFAAGAAAGGGRPQPGVWDGPPPESQISAFQLGFGSVAGICTGVFLKKGLKAIAFLLGGAFVLLQVGLVSLSSRRAVADAG